MTRSRGTAQEKTRSVASAGKDTCRCIGKSFQKRQAIAQSAGWRLNRWRRAPLDDPRICDLNEDSGWRASGASRFLARMRNDPGRADRRRRRGRNFLSDRVRAPHRWFLWAGGFLEKGLEICIHRSPNRFTLISLGRAPAYLFSVAHLFRWLRSRGPWRQQLFEAAAVITVLAIVGNSA